MTLDTTDPTMSITSVQTTDGGTILSSGSSYRTASPQLNVSGTFTENNVADFAWNSGGVSYSGSAFWFLVPLSGDRNVTAILTDAVDQTDNDSIEIDHDVEGPHMTLISPWTNYTQTVNVTVQITTDELAVCYINPEAANFNYEVQMNSTNNRTHWFQYTAADNLSEIVNPYMIWCDDELGNRAFEDMTLTLDSVDPRISVSYTPDFIISLGTPLEVDVVTRDQNNDLEATYCTYSYRNQNNTSNPIVVTITPPIEYSTSKHIEEYIPYEEFGGGNGLYVMDIQCEDRAGNMDNESFQFSVDTEWPLRVFIDSPSSSAASGSELIMRINITKTPENCVYSELNGRVASGDIGSDRVIDSFGT